MGGAFFALGQGWFKRWEGMAFTLRRHWKIARKFFFDMVVWAKPPLEKLKTATWRHVAAREIKEVDSPPLG
jgi:hypothetical protein